MEFPNYRLDNDTIGTEPYFRGKVLIENNQHTKNLANKNIDDMKKNGITAIIATIVITMAIMEITLNNISLK